MTHRDEDEEIIDGALDTLAWQRREIDRLNAENERLQRSAEGWEADAKRYAANQEHWRAEERAAIVAWLREGSNDAVMLAVLRTAANTIEEGEWKK